MGIASLILGIAGVLVATFGGAIFGTAESLVYHGWITAAIGLAMCIVGIVLGAKGKKIPEQKGISLAGMIVSIVATVYCAFTFLSAAVCSGFASGVQ